MLIRHKLILNTVLAASEVNRNVNNIREIAAAGADTFVAGSAIFNAPDYREVIAKMHAELALARP